MIDDTKEIQYIALAVVSLGLIVGVSLIAYFGD